MPGNKKKKTKCYSLDDLASALAAIRDGMSKTQASKTWKVPRTTLIDAYQEKYSLGKHLPGIVFYLVMVSFSYINIFYIYKD